MYGVQDLIGSDLSGRLRGERGKETQAGFRKGTGTMDNVMILQHK